MKFSADYPTIVTYVHQCGEPNGRNLPTIWAHLGTVFTTQLWYYWACCVYNLVDHDFPHSFASSFALVNQNDKKGDHLDNFSEAVNGTSSNRFEQARKQHVTHPSRCTSLIPVGFVDQHGSVLTMWWLIIRLPMFLMAVWRYSNVFEDHQYWIWLVNYFIHIYIYII